MCGIGGIIKVTPAGEAAAAALALPPREAIPEAWLDILDESVRHRGPDGQGRFRDRVVRADGSVVDVALVHRRLSIIDHVGGAQPMVSVCGGRGPALRAGLGGAVARGAMTPLLFHGKPNAPVVYEGMREVEARGQDARATAEGHGQDARATARHPELALGAPSDLVAVVFNGCIYNHRELRRELLSAGHEFKTDHSDTEVLLHGWREWGERLFEKLDGMFALAIWDRAAAKLVVARDRCGEKPLFTRVLDRGVCAVSSCLPGLCRLSHVFSDSARMQPVVLDRWLRFGFDHAAPTGESQVERSNWTAIDEAEMSHIFYFHPVEEDERPAASLSAAALEQRLDETIFNAVETELDADVPVGCFLSGGVDSSLIARAASRLRPGLVTFAVRMPDARFDESEIAARVAAGLGTRHVTLDAQASAASDLVGLIRQLGLPFGDSSLLPTFWLSRAVRGCVPVALGGDGGDELFLGYDRHRLARWFPKLRKLCSVLPASLLPDRQPKSRFSRLARLTHASRANDLLELIAIFPAHYRRRLCSTPCQRLAAAADLSELQSFEISTYLPEDLLRKSDTASMSVALELRSPLLQREVLHLALQLEFDQLMPRGQRKGLLRQVARKYFPAEIVDRPKQGFAIPIGEWFRSDYGGMKQLLMDHLESAEPWGPARLGIELNMPFVRRMVDEHMNQRRDHSQRLYMLLVLSIWAKWMGSL